MKNCFVCHGVFADDQTVCPNDQVPLSLGYQAARLHVNASGYYHSGRGGIDWMESTLRSLDEVLAAIPSHEAAAALKAQIEKALPAVAARVDELFRAAEARLDSGDLVGCLEILTDLPALRESQAKTLRTRVRQRIAEGVEPKQNDEKARRLAKELFRDLHDLYIEGLGNIDWAEELSSGLAEVLFLSPRLISLRLSCG